MVVHSGQVEALEADTGHPVFYLLRPQLRRLLLLLDQPWRRRKGDMRGKVRCLFISYLFFPFVFPGKHDLSITVTEFNLIYGGLWRWISADFPNEFR